jgi:hypothetical protein
VRCIAHRAVVCCVTSLLSCVVFLSGWYVDPDALLPLPFPPLFLGDLKGHVAWVLVG